MSICNNCGACVSDASQCAQETCYFYATDRTPPSILSIPRVADIGRISLAGFDDDVAIDYLQCLVAAHTNVELGILFYPEKEGQPRNPSRDWRELALAQLPKDKLCIHLCGKQIFSEILGKRFEWSARWKELSQYGKIQLNINARKKEFSGNEVIQLYSKLLSLNKKIVLQYNDESKIVIDAFLSKISKRVQHNIEILVDSSRGRGMPLNVREACKDISDVAKGYPLIFAGGINSQTIQGVLNDLSHHYLAKKIKLDLESGIRRNNKIATDLISELLAK